MTKFRNGLDRVTRIGRALSSPIRVRALESLKEREFCLCELTELFGLAPSTLSKHMSVLADAELVQSRRDGQWTHYSLPTEPDEAAGLALRLVDLLAGDDGLVLEDAGRTSRLTCGV